ncbi:MAG: FISUMP domain-containing protein [Saprospiraceae bacterium]|nr:FISUMP domain-containing protein [Saprospiraceae bacterium]
MSLKSQQIIGLQQQAEKIVAHINELRKALAIENDASARFSLTEKIAGLEAELEQIKSKIEQIQAGNESIIINPNLNNSGRNKRFLLWLVGGALAVSVGVWGVLNSNFTINNNFEDPRDGKVYKTVKIGNKIWMAENLNYETPNSWCYDDDPTKCSAFGRLYSWSAAMKACPRGWHLPTKQEWVALAMHFGAQEQSEASLIIIPNNAESLAFINGYGGRRDSKGNYDALGDTADFWTSTELANSGDAISAYLTEPNTSISESLRFSHFKNDGLTCRCVKD